LYREAAFFYMAELLFLIKGQVPIIVLNVWAFIILGGKFCLFSCPPPYFLCLVVHLSVQPIFFYAPFLWSSLCFRVAAELKEK